MSPIRPLTPRFALPCAALALLLAAPAAAQLTPYAVPDDPAFSFLGASPQTVDTPGSLGALGLALAGGVNADGRAQSGLALSVAPWDYLGLPLPVEAYRAGTPRFWAYNTQVSLGSVRASGDTTATDLGLSVRTVLLGPDPLADPAHRAAVRAAMGACLDDPETAVACANAAVGTLEKAWWAAHWNAPALSVAAATGTRFEASALTDRAWLGYTLWAVGAVPLGAWGQLSGQVRYEQRETAADSTGANGLHAGARALLGGARRRAFAEWSRRVDGGEGPRDVWSVGAEVEVTEGIWLSAGFGERYAEAVEDTRAALLFNLRWGLARKSNLGPG